MRSASNNSCRIHVAKVYENTDSASGVEQRGGICMRSYAHEMIFGLVDVIFVSVARWIRPVTNRWKGFAYSRFSPRPYKLG